MSKTYIRVYLNGKKVRSTGSEKWYRKCELNKLRLDLNLNYLDFGSGIVSNDDNYKRLDTIYNEYVFLKLNSAILRKMILQISEFHDTIKEYIKSPINNGKITETLAVELVHSNKSGKYVIKKVELDKDTLKWKTVFEVERKIFIIGSVSQESDIIKLASRLSSGPTKNFVKYVHKQPECTYDELIKNAFDEIEKADDIYVVTKKDGSIGIGTTYEAEYAKRIGKHLHYIFPQSL